MGASRTQENIGRVPNGVGRINSDKVCFRCNGLGHLSRECPSSVHVKGASKEREWGGGGETWGNPLGGLSEKGPDIRGQRHKVSVGCYKCGEEGHLSRECGLQGGGAGGVRRNREERFQCGDEGHFARDCRPERREMGKGRGGEREGDRSRGEVYVPDESLEENLYLHGVNSGINFSKYENIPVKVTGEEVPEKIDTFADANLLSLIMANIAKSRYQSPTPVQKYALPMVLTGRDVMGCAQTGSGKTAAFLIPIIHKLLEGGVGGNGGHGVSCPEVVIMSPTRELAIQIKDEARKFCSGSPLKCVVAYGGTSLAHQANILSEGCNILVATPGRLNDFVERGRISYSKLQFLVLDEADRMLDMGFKEDIGKMVRNTDMPSKGIRQTLMFSATYPDEIQKMAFEFMSNYLFLAVGVVGGACSDVSQTFLQVPMYEKREKLLDLVRESANQSQGLPTKTLVFVETKKTADFIASYLCQSEFAATSIHGDR